ncbi:MarR family transcriptional regulator [Microbacterium sp. dk485]|uniref:MarR family transcriptional regulator n=1 Tax=Microbacterium wangchenii TaxID=2541726 RepID=A0ABX5SY33_9MICO|nr:MarR family transcriptional regulator [Microbacterium wangchenii]TFV85392.1 MarR family transcriptional regulator [Microbacterium sp. dk485]TXK16653.1 MarR family transcriptional regulator [Microbacterium wangchenii]
MWWFDRCVTRRVEPSPSVSPEPTLRHALRHVSKQFSGQLQRRIQEHGVSHAEYVAMFALKRLPNLSSAEVSRWTGVTPQAGNQIVQGLLERELVQRHPSRDHGRVLLIELTDEGRRVIDACERDANDLENQMCQEMTGEQRSELMSLLRLAAAGLGSPISSPAR